MDYPGLIVPTPFKVEGKAEYDEATSAMLNDVDSVVKQLWKNHNYDGAPISFNIVAKRHMENELLAAAGMIQKALRLP